MDVRNEKVAEALAEGSRDRSVSGTPGTHDARESPPHGHHGDLRPEASGTTRTTAHLVAVALVRRVAAGQASLLG